MSFHWFSVQLTMSWGEGVERGQRGVCQVLMWTVRHFHISQIVASQEQSSDTHLCQLIRWQAKVNITWAAFICVLKRTNIFISLYTLAKGSLQMPSGLRLFVFHFCFSSFTLLLSLKRFVTLSFKMFFFNFLSLVIVEFPHNWSRKYSKLTPVFSSLLY